ncbi:MAG: hypothetical protein ACO3B3_11840 [Cyanobium sp.]
MARIFRRIADPPKCLELDSIDQGQEQSFLFQRSASASGEDPSLPYVIQQKGYGRGLLSLASSVVCHVHVAKRYSLKPYVDFSSHYTEYSDQEYESAAGHPSSNSWEYYFKPVSSLTSKAVQQAPYCLASPLGFPSGYPRKMLISQVQELRDIAEAVLQPVHEIELDVQKTIQHLSAEGSVLAVHFRGQEQKTMPYHPLSPTSQQIFSAIDRALDQHDFARIFLATEDLDYLDTLVSRYGDRVFSLSHFRTRSPVNAYRINPRPMHRYWLGREILTDTLVLSRCDGLVSSTSNVTEIARAINNGRYRLDLVIDNGLNVHQRWLARYVWDIKKMMPARLGGFSDAAITPYPSLSSGALSDRVVSG